MKIQLKNAVRAVKQMETLSKLAGLDYPNCYDLLETLHRLETKANRVATDKCNGYGDADKHTKQIEAIRKKVLALLPDLDPKDFFINGDPRGYSLKIREEKAKSLGFGAIHTDFGGYGILAPEF